MGDKPKTAILPCKKCGAMPVLVPAEILQFGMNNIIPAEYVEAYFRCEECLRRASLEPYKAAIEKWNEEQRVTLEDLEATALAELKK